MLTITNETKTVEFAKAIAEGELIKLLIDSDWIKQILTELGYSDMGSNYWDIL